MTKWIEATGKTVEDATQNALRQLGMDRDSVSVEIIELGKKGGLFGFGAAPAKVKVTYEAPDVLPPQPLTPPESPTPAPPKTPKKREEKPRPAHIQQEQAEELRSPTPSAVPAAPPAASASEEQLEETVRTFLSGLFDHMKVEADISLSVAEDHTVLVTLVGQKLGPLIGHRGETLDAIQQLTNYAVNRGRSKRVRIRLDAENYRSKREEALRKLAEKVAGKVVKSRSNITLEPMNAYERHVIHETLQDYPNVITYSTGTEPNRRTVVAFSRGKHAY